MIVRNSLDTLREDLRRAVASSQPPAVSASPQAGASHAYLPGAEVGALVKAARDQLAERIRLIGTAPEWTPLAHISGGAAGVSLLLDVVGLATESGIRSVATGGVDLNRHAHGLVDAWGRAEAGRALLVELFELWPAGAPMDRVSALHDGVEAVCSDCVARAFEESLNLVQLVDFIKEMGIGA